MDLTWFQKMLLAVLAGMLVFFGVLMAVFRSHPGVLFEGSLLKITEQDGWIVYSGKVRGEPVDIAVTWPTNFETDVEFTMGERFRDVVRVIYPTERIQTEHGDSVGGILITKNEKTLFEGGYDSEAEYGWYDKDGKWTPQTTFQVVFGSSGTDPRHDYENTAGTAVRFAFGPGRPGSVRHGGVPDGAAGAECRLPQDAVPLAALGCPESGTYRGVFGAGAGGLGCLRNSDCHGVRHLRDGNLLAEAL